MEKDYLKKIKKRIFVGGCAIFSVSCVELWDIEKISKTTVIILALFMAVTVSVLGYLFMKWFIKKNSKDE